MKTSTKFGIILGILHLIGPLVFIWSVNTLFNVGIPFSFKTWFAALLLLYFIKYYTRGPRTLDDALFFTRYWERDHHDDDDSDSEDDEDTETEDPGEKAERTKGLDEKLTAYRREREKMLQNKKK